jgi:hypothetical protein
VSSWEPFGLQIARQLPSGVRTSPQAHQACGAAGGAMHM